MPKPESSGPGSVKEGQSDPNVLPFPPENVLDEIIKQDIETKQKAQSIIDEMWEFGFQQQRRALEYGNRFGITPTNMAKTALPTSLGHDAKRPKGKINKRQAVLKVLEDGVPRGVKEIMAEMIPLGVKIPSGGLRETVSQTLYDLRDMGLLLHDKKNRKWTIAPEKKQHTKPKKG